MTSEQLIARLRSTLATPLPLPGQGHTALRHRLLMEIGLEDLSLARLAEAHWDAVAILAEAARPAEPGAIYAVWASEIPGKSLALDPDPEKEDAYTLTGSKMFCTGAGLVDRALITAGPQLIDLDLRTASITIDDSAWKTAAFRETHTATVTFNATPVPTSSLIGAPGFYLDRPGFWHGALGPASCWAGGAAGLFQYALGNPRSDPHTLAHLGAMHSLVWALGAYLETSGHEIDAHPNGIPAAHTRALTVRHLVEQAASEILRRIPRAYGPHPLAMDTEVSRRYNELDLYLRQCHAERDLEALGLRADRIDKG